MIDPETENLKNAIPQQEININRELSRNYVYVQIPQTNGNNV